MSSDPLPMSDKDVMKSVKLGNKIAAEIRAGTYKPGKPKNETDAALMRHRFLWEKLR